MNEIHLVQNFWTNPDFLYEWNTAGPDFLDQPRFSIRMKYTWSRTSGNYLDFVRMKYTWSKISGTSQISRKNGGIQVVRFS
jgi:hypothetical protein